MAAEVGYHEQIAKIRRGEAPYETTDVFMRRKLDELIPKYGIKGLTEEQIDWLHKVWHRLDPWPDSVEGLTRLKKKFVIATLSNGNVALLINMAKRGGLPWDMIFSAELVREVQARAGDVPLVRAAYRPADESGDDVGGPPARPLLVARARACATAFIRRPNEWGPNGPQEGEPDREKIDIVAKDFVDLARAARSLTDTRQGGGSGGTSRLLRDWLLRYRYSLRRPAAAPSGLRSGP